MPRSVKKRNAGALPAQRGPSQRMVRPEVMAAYRRSNKKYRELYKKLAK
jgi:hypothetical protein